MFKSRFSSVTGTLAGVLILWVGTLTAQIRVQDRIKGKIEPNITTVLSGNVHPLATAGHDHGRLPGSFRVERVTMMFKMTDMQQAALNDLLQGQQDPGSVNYHRWLSPEDFASRFGISAPDRNKVVSWLRAQGFTVNEVGRNGRSVTFTGSAGEIESVFHTSIHRYEVNGESFYANSTEPSVPAAMADLVLGFRALNSFRLKPRPSSKTVNVPLSPQFTSNLTGNHFLSPSDFATIYDLNGLYANGLDGRGQSIVVVGQTEIDLNDIRAFRNASGLPPNDPKVVLIPGSTDPGIVKDDLGEADLDLEWAGAVAPNAQLIFVTSTNVLDSLQYAIDQNLAPVTSISYGSCERNFTSQDLSLVAALAQQANAQGMTIVAASGDNGAADCESSSATIATQGLAVDAPASLPYVTGMGGSEFRETGVSWSSSNSPANGSALAYIPETAWNDTSLMNNLSASGGGRSSYFSKPAWQAGPGVPNDSARDVPDLSLNASGEHDGYLICSAGSCVNGFRSATSNLFVAGGTSAAAPTFAGILALINQKTGTSQGNVNPVLYGLASTAPAAFHDITSGGNQVPCLAQTVDCASGGNIGYSAGPGYDQATGLGSVDVLNLIAAWPSAPQSTSSGSSTGGADTSGGNSSTSATVTTAPQPIPVVEQGAIRTGYAVITPDSNSSLPVPTVTFGVVSNGIVQAQAGISPSGMMTDGSLFADVIPGIGRDLGVALVNRQANAIVVNLTLRDAAGNAVGSPVSVSLSPNQQVARFVSELFSTGILGAGFRGSLRLQSTNAFGALGLRFSGAEFSTLPVVVTSSDSGSGSVLTLPQFAIGGGWATQIALVNNGASANSGRIDLYDSAGNPMPVTMNGLAQSGFTYSIPAGGVFLLAPRDANGQSPF
jgi:subtilase family serine protease